MKKKLNEETIKNELHGSAFFRKSDPLEINSDKDQLGEITQPRDDDNVIPRYHDHFIDDIRKALKPFGKEAATHRFTPDEKNMIADLIYSYRNKGIQTSENEITRIAINFIIQEHNEFGDNSILDSVLKLLND